MKSWIVFKVDDGVMMATEDNEDGLFQNMMNKEGTEVFGSVQTKSAKEAIEYIENILND